MAIGRPIPPLTLDDGERETLEQWVRRPKTAQALALRARIILSCADDLASDDALDDWLLGIVSTAQHISCTCKMGPSSDPMAVVDQYGRVHGLDNIRVVDASIMPDCIRANTNVTTMMIGERVSEFILSGK